MIDPSLSIWPCMLTFHIVTLTVSLIMRWIGSVNRSWTFGFLSSGGNISSGVVALRTGGTAYSSRRRFLGLSVPGRSSQSLLVVVPPGTAVFGGTWLSIASPYAVRAHIPGRESPPRDSGGRVRGTELDHCNCRLTGLHDVQNCRFETTRMLAAMPSRAMTGEPYSMATSSPHRVAATPSRKAIKPIIR